MLQAAAAEVMIADPGQALTTPPALTIAEAADHTAGLIIIVTPILATIIAIAADQDLTADLIVHQAAQGLTAIQVIAADPAEAAAAILQEAPEVAAVILQEAPEAPAQAAGPAAEAADQEEETNKTEALKELIP